ncbi:MAG: protein kinase [Myxococcales bacterium]|nr:protein kinase [Myxococcales bacterium]
MTQVHSIAGAGRLVKLSGDIDERFDRKQLAVGPLGVLVLDLDGVNRITSYGVRNWLEVVGGLSADYYCFSRCRPQIMAQFNTVSGFAGRGELISFYLPYQCGKCGRQVELLFDARFDVPPAEPPPVPCPSCGAMAEFDDDPSVYFEYAKSVLRPSPPPLVDALLKGAPEPGPHRLKLSKEVRERLTVMTLSGDLDGRANLRRLAAGVEGEVALVTADLAAICEQGLAQLLELVFSDAIRVQVLRAPLHFVRALSDTRGGELVPLLSAVLPHRCESCDQVALLEVRGRGLHLNDGERCPRCQSQLRPSLGAAETSKFAQLLWVEPSQAITEWLFEKASPARCGQCGLDHSPRDLCPTLVGRSPFSAQWAAPLPGAEDGLLGTAIGSFRIVRKLGAGGMGTVYLGEHTVIGSKVAVKVLHEHLSSDSALISRFYAEARAVNLIGHENIVNIFDMNVVPPRRYYFIMEYLEGRPLAELIEQPMEESRVVAILRQVCDALHAAHSSGVIHRDLKPENIFVLDKRRGSTFVKVLDFGVAKLFALENDPQRTPVGVIVGTPEYMAPEWASGAPVDGRADVYSLGVIAYQVVTGKLPFRAGGVTSVLLAHREVTPPPPDEVNPNVSAALSTAIMKAIAKNPADRFSDAAVFREALDEVPVAPIMGSGLKASEWSPPGSQHMRHQTDLPATVLSPEGTMLVDARCTDLSRTGMFLLCSQPPPLSTSVQVQLTLPEGQSVAVRGMVVRLIHPSDADAWGLPPGFGLEMDEVPPAIESLLATLPPLKLPPPPASLNDEPRATPIITKYHECLAGDFYSILGLEREASLARVKQQARAVRLELEATLQLRLSAKQRAHAEALLHRARQAADTLSSALARLEYDGSRGNFKGAAQAIASGVTPAQAEEVRRRLLALKSQSARDDSERRFKEALAAAEEDPALALAQLEAALLEDPLNLEYQQRYWLLRRKMHTPP